MVNEVSTSTANPITNMSAIKVSKKELLVWNSMFQSTLNGISFNEEYNKSVGLPPVEVRTFLRKLYSDKYGVCGGELTWKDIPIENRSK